MPRFNKPNRSTDNPAIALRYRNRNTIFKAVVELFKENGGASVSEVCNHLNSRGFKFNRRVVERHLLKLLDEDFVVIHRKKKNPDTGKRYSVYRPNKPTAYNMTPDQRKHYNDSKKECQEFIELFQTQGPTNCKELYWDTVYNIYKNATKADLLARQYKESWIRGNRNLEIGEREIIVQEIPNLSKQDKKQAAAYRDVDDLFVYTFFGQFLTGLTLEIL